jgi:G3E family GTPase
LLQHILSNKLNLSIACGVHDLASINVDEQLISYEHSVLNKQSPDMLQLFNGCICSALVLEESSDFSALKNFVWKLIAPESSFKMDYLVLETSGTTDPIELLQALQQKFGKLTRVRLDAVVTVVDADVLAGTASLHPVMQTQLKCADIVLLNKVDLLSTESLVLAREKLHRLVPDVVTHECSHGNVHLPLFLDVSAMEIPQTITHEHTPAQWLVTDPLLVEAGLRHLPTPQTTPSTFASVSFESETPLRLHALHRWLSESSTRVMRVKGMLCFAEDPATRYVLQVSGRRRLELINCGPWTCTPHTQLVVIGTHSLDTETISQQLCDMRIEKVTFRAARDRFEESRRALEALVCFQVVERLPGGFSLRFRLQCPTSDLDETTLRHHHHINRDEMNASLVSQCNAMGHGMCLVPLVDRDTREVSVGVSCYDAHSVLDLLEVMRERSEAILMEVRKKLSQCLCGF